MRTLVRAGVLLGTIAILGGCSRDATGPVEYEVSVSTDRESYSLATDSVAVITLHNRSAGPVHLPMGMYVFYELQENGAWGEPTPWFIVDGVGPSFAVAAGETREDGLSIRFYLGERPGTYRIRYLVYTDGPLRHLLPESQRVSAPFTVTE
jgi:hypothetical protein